MMKASSFSGSFLWLEPTGRKAKVVCYWVGSWPYLGTETWLPRTVHSYQLLALVGISFTCRYQGYRHSFQCAEVFPHGLIYQLPFWLLRPTSKTAVTPNCTGRCTGKADFYYLSKWFAVSSAFSVLHTFNYSSGLEWRWGWGSEIWSVLI